MVEAQRTVMTLEGAIKAYGGVGKIEAAFKLPDGELARWRQDGVPRAHALGLLLGLQARGFDVSPKLYGVESWLDIQGVL
jgi:hypothetical protein